MDDFRQIKVPPRIAELGFSCLLHKDFREIELPREELDFSNPIVCCPLLAAMASYGLVVFSVAARPGYDNGTLRDWCGFLCEAQGMTVEAIGAGLIGGVPAIVAQTTQVQEGVTLRTQVGAIEDGSRLILLSAMAPEPVWASVKDMLLLMFDSFKLDQPRGRTVELA